MIDNHIKQYQSLVKGRRLTLYPAIVAALESCGWLTPTEIVRITGFPFTSVHPALSNMRELGLILQTDLRRGEGKRGETVVRLAPRRG